MVRTRNVVAILFVLGGVTAVAGGLGFLALTLDGTTPAEESNGTAVPESVAEIHADGVTGENVTVGVLDVTGFDTDRELLAGRVAGTARFGDATMETDARVAHGTKTALTIARLAPDAELYLGVFETADDYAAGMDWLVEQGVDVVVTPVAYAGTLGDGTSALSRATTNATARGVTVVAPAGNLGQSHWLGEYAPTEDGVHVFENGTLNGIAGPTGRAEFWLTTDDPTGDYRLELHELQDEGETDLVAESVAHEPGDLATERLTVRLDEGRYALVVRGPKADTDARIRVASATHSFSRTRPAGSVTAPATAPGALSVGAFDPATGGTAPYSSRGPTLDGRLGVHVVGPGTLAVPGGDTYEGTSAGATFVGGVAALVLDATPELEPAELHEIITSTADSIGGVDARSGHGRVAPREAVEAAVNRTDVGESRSAEPRSADSSNPEFTYGKVCPAGERTGTRCRT